MSQQQTAPHQASQTAAPGNQTQADPLFEQRVAALTRRERELVKREQSLNGAMTWDQVAEMAKKDQSAFFKKLGIELPKAEEEVPEHIREFRELKAQIEAEKRAQQEKAERDELLSKFKDNEKYDLLNRLNNQDALYGEYRRAREAGEEIDPFQIGDQIESNLLSLLESVKDSPKLKHWFQSQSAPQGQSQQGSQRHPLDVSRTATAQDRAPAPGPDSAPDKLLSKQESLRYLAQKYGNPT